MTSPLNQTYRSALVSLIPDFNTSLPIDGSVVLLQHPNQTVLLALGISGLKPFSQHGWHVHSKPIQGNNCSLAGGHFNPRNVRHGKPSNNWTARHFGDLGNFKTDAHGNVTLIMSDTYVTLYGNESVNGLSIVVHEKEDDYGLGIGPDSLKTGNAGGRLACGNIVVKEKTKDSPLGYPVAIEKDDATGTASSSSSQTRDSFPSRTRDTQESTFTAANNYPTRTSTTKTAGNTGKTAALYDQCGGIGYSGPTSCPAGATCHERSVWYSQCILSSNLRRR